MCFPWTLHPSIHSPAATFVYLAQPDSHYCYFSVVPLPNLLRTDINKNMNNSWAHPAPSLLTIGCAASRKRVDIDSIKGNRFSPRNWFPDHHAPPPPNLLGFPAPLATPPSASLTALERERERELSWPGTSWEVPCWGSWAPLSGSVGSGRSPRPEGPNAGDPAGKLGGTRGRTHRSARRVRPRCHRSPRARAGAHSARRRVLQPRPRLSAPHSSHPAPPAKAYWLVRLSLDPRIGGDKEGRGAKKRGAL